MGGGADVSVGAPVGGFPAPVNGVTEAGGGGGGGGAAAGFGSAATGFGSAATGFGSAATGFGSAGGVPSLSSFAAFASLGPSAALASGGAALAATDFEAFSFCGFSFSVGAACFSAAFSVGFSAFSCGGAVPTVV